MTGPATLPATAESIRFVRNSVARDIATSRRRIAELSQQLRTERATLAGLECMAEIVGITEVSTERQADITDAGVQSAEKVPDSESPTG